MVWKGVIIDESLNDKSLLDLIQILKSRETTLTQEENRGILHFHNIQVEDYEKDEFIKKAILAIKPRWYLHICKDNTMIVVYQNKFFEIKDKYSLKQARDYGLNIGILEEQLPEIEMIKNPFA